MNHHVATDAEATVLFARNISLLSPYMGDVLRETLSASDPLDPYLSVAGQGGGTIVRFGDLPLYPEPAEIFAARQVEDYLRAPDRLYFGENPNIEDNELFSWSQINEVHCHENCHETGGGERVSPDNAEGGFLLSYGLGLGLHLLELIGRIEFRSLIVVESLLESVVLSLSRIDWKPITEHVAARGGRISFILSQDAEAAAIAAIEQMRGPDFAFLEGSYFFKHRDDTYLSAIREKLEEQKYDIVSYNGFLEDEVLHYSNNAHIFQAGGFNLIDHAAEPTKIPAIVIGNGPSLDGSIDLIKKLADRAVIFSAGSALGTLLNHGIQPHFHCELENLHTLSKIFADVAAEHDLGDIAFIGSTTVDPKAVRFFNRRFLFFRDGDASLKFIASDQHQLHGCGPSCTNTASRLAIEMGHREIYLFGVDYGAIDSDKHHASGSIYETVKDGEDPYNLAQGAATAAMRIRVAGNLSPTVITNESMVMMRTGLEVLCRMHPEVKIHNCSDGARISGAEPLPPAQLRLARRALTAEKIHQTADRNYPGPLPRTLRSFDRDATYLRGLENWFDEAHALILRELETLAGFDSFLGAMNDHLHPAAGGESTMDTAARAIVEGSVTRILHYLRHTFLRLSPGDAEAFHRRALQALAWSWPDFRARLAPLAAFALADGNITDKERRRWSVLEAHRSYLAGDRLDGEAFGKALGDAFPGTFWTDRIKFRMLVQENRHSDAERFADSRDYQWPGFASERARAAKTSIR